MRIAVLLFCAMSYFVPLAVARDIFVNNLAGEDRFSGLVATTDGDRSGPVRTIGRALQIAHRADRIVLAKTDQPYRESITLQGVGNSGYADKPFTIQGNGAMLDGSVPVPGDAWQHVRGNIFRFRLRRLGHHQLFADGLPLVRRHVSSDGKIPDLKPLQWCMSRAHAYFCTEDSKSPRNYEMTHSGHSVGITLYRVDHVVIFDLIVQGYQLDGINAHDLARNVSLVGVASRGNGRSGVSVGGASQVTVQACTLHENGTAQLRTEGECQAHVRLSGLLPESAPRWHIAGGRLWVDGKRVNNQDAATVPDDTAPDDKAPQP
ncbi:MAG: right-handed parallel beta-helix repeat-containing protein [Planctomycetes bacterium]|nr:right-handed parallel beta-helix repeat-containing protein [Planctomycetota bacterium]